MGHPCISRSQEQLPSTSSPQALSHMLSDKRKAPAVAEAALEGRPDGAHEEGPEQGIAEQATQDDFLDSITQTEGPIALYKQNRLSGRYRRVHLSSQ